MDALIVAIAVVVSAVVVASMLVARRRPDPTDAPALIDDDDRPKVRLLSRLLFARRDEDAFTLDCTLASGLPFTLQVHAPETEWFAGRVEQLLAEWAEDERELVLELTKGYGGKVRTTIAAGDSSLQLELVGAAGLRPHLR